MFTAIMVTRAIINLIYGGRNIKSISIGTAITPAPNPDPAT